MCVCKTNARRVLGCTKVPSYTSYLRFLRPPSLPLELDSCMDGITFVDGFSLIILNNSTRVMGRADSSIMNADNALFYSSMPGRSTHTTWAFGMAVNSFLLGMCSVSLFQRRVKRFEVVFSSVAVLKFLILHLSFD